MVGNAMADPDYDYCLDENSTEICATLPQDLTVQEAENTYNFMDEPSQLPFDRFGWRTLVALNWPVFGNNRDRKPWEEFTNADVLFPPETDLKCRPHPEQLHVWRYLQTSGLPLIDKEGNYVVYAIHLNDAMANQIREQNLNSKAGLSKVSEVSFQAGRHTEEMMTEAALMMKSAWRVFEKPDQKYFRRRALLEVLPADSQSGERLCQQVTLGLVGLHVVQKTTTGLGDHWNWSTYEHVDNVPLAKNARRPGASFSRNFFKNGCQHPDHVQRDYSFFPKGPMPEPKEITEWKWAGQPPYAVSAKGDMLPPHRVSRCWKIFAGTQNTNQLW